jgi:D-arabinose 1-dehydrogenase-like Zn-dependent alcohol dehydrogenase
MFDIHGCFLIVGFLGELLSSFRTMSLLGHGVFLGGSHTGFKKECPQILKLTVDDGVKLWITLLLMNDAKKAAEAMKKANKHESSISLP